MEKKTAVLTVLGVLSLAASFAATGPAARPPATPAGQAPPGEFEPMKGKPMFGARLIFNCAKAGRIFLLNPHKYEVSVFKDRKLESTLAGQSELFKPLQRMGRGIVSTAAHGVASGCRSPLRRDAPSSARRKPTAAPSR